MELFGITVLEYVGYLASLMVLLSFTMKGIKKLRLVNMIGCILFILYGFLMPSLRIGLPIIIANVAIFSVNFYYLLQKPAPKNN
nr:uroporphyrinogen decarboxylase [Aestuariivivens marinum]